MGSLCAWRVMSPTVHTAASTHEDITHIRCVISLVGGPHTAAQQQCAPKGSAPSKNSGLQDSSRLPQEETFPTSLITGEAKGLCAILTEEGLGSLRLISLDSTCEALSPLDPVL